MRKVIYTCLTGNYDDLQNPAYIEEGWDYICFTDNKLSNKDSIWQFRKLPYHLNDKLRTSRYPKLNPHIVLEEYEISIYIDANIQILDNRLYERAEELIAKNTTISIAKHPLRNSLYEEAEICKALGKDYPSVIDKHTKRYKTLGFPNNYGLFENNIIFRKHNELIELADLWWKEFDEGPKRDQLSLTYCLWKLSIKCEPLFPEGFDVRKDSSFNYVWHSKPHSIKYLVKIKNFIKRLLSILPNNRYS